MVETEGLTVTWASGTAVCQTGEESPLLDSPFGQGISSLPWGALISFLLIPSSDLRGGVCTRVRTWQRWQRRRRC